MAKVLAGVLTDVSILSRQPLSYTPAGVLAGVFAGVSAGILAGVMAGVCIGWCRDDTTQAIVIQFTW